MSAVLVPRNTEMVAGILDGLNRLEGSKREILEKIPTFEDEEIVQTRMAARGVSVWSWVIECACDAEIDRRLEAPRGRGKKDVDGKGKIAAINKHAYQCGQTPRQIQRNIQIFNTFKNDVIDHTILEEKGFYEAALRAPDPHAAIEKFAAQKDSNPFYRVRDAHRDAEKMKNGNPPKKMKLSAVLQAVHDQAVKDDLEKTVGAIKARNATPATPLLGALNRSLIEKLEWQRDRTVEGDCARILEAINDGYQVEHDILGWLTDRLFLMAENEFDERLDRMLEIKVIKTTKQGGKGERTRGDRTTMYLPYGQRTGDAYSAPHANSVYEMGERE